MVVPQTIALDGPAGSGKTTVGNMLAEQMGYTFVDSGQLYRAVARQMLFHGVDASDETTVAHALRSYAIEVRSLQGNGRPAIFVEGQDISTQNLHDASINLVVPIIAAYPDVRSLIRTIQHQVAAVGQIVLAGRDIGTVVLPNADLKIFLVVSLAERVRRRYAAMSHLPGITQKRVKEDLRRRDALDSSRSHSPLRVAEDAVEIRTDGLMPSEVVERISSIWYEHAQVLA